MASEENIGNPDPFPTEGGGPAHNTSEVDYEVALTAHALCVVSQWVQSVPQVY